MRTNKSSTSSVDVNHGIYMATPHILNWAVLIL